MTTVRERRAFFQETLLKAYKREKKKQLYHGYGVTKYTGN
jgi:hypothetical protein